MHLDYVEVTEFRNLFKQRVVLPQRISLFVGQNGQGKTSLLEAIFFLSQTKSFRTAVVAELRSWQKAGVHEQNQKLAVCGEFTTNYGRKHLSCELFEGKKNVLLNGNRLERAADFYGQLTTVVFTPEDLLLVRGAPSVRRQFFDRVLGMCDSTYVEELVHYQRVLRNRNRLLTTINRGALEQSIDPWNELLVEHAVIIAEKRARLVNQLKDSFISYYAKLSASAPERLFLGYRSHLLSEGGGIKDKASALSMYQAYLERDLHNRTTILGIHRDEIELSFDTDYGHKVARRSASQGQARSLVLALALAAHEYIGQQNEEQPILLLDDVESELDSPRKEALFKALTNLSCQVIFTATDISTHFCQIKNASIFAVENGLVKQVDGLKFS